LGWDPVTELAHPFLKSVEHLLLTLLVPKGLNLALKVLQGCGMRAHGPAGGKDGENEKGQVEQEENGREIEQSRLHAGSPR
jgi:hypothetical protein